MLLRKFSMCSHDVKIHLFQTYCSPMYTAQLWWSYNKSSIKKLYIAYNNVFRMLHRLPRDCSASAMFVNSHVKNCSAIIRNLVYRFIRRLELSENGIILSVLNSDLRWQSRIRRHWINILYNNVDFLEKVPYN